MFMCTPVSQNASVHVHTSVPTMRVFHVHTSVPECECSCAHQCPQNVSVHVHTSVPECECTCAHQCPQNASVHVHTSVPECECSCAHQCPQNASVHVQLCVKVEDAVSCPDQNTLQLRVEYIITMCCTERKGDEVYPCWDVCGSGDETTLIHFATCVQG